MFYVKLIVAALIATALLTATGCDPKTNNDGSGSGNPGPGGRVRVTLDSAKGVKVYNSWGSQGPAGESQTVKPGQASRWADADGFCSPLNLRTRYVITWALLGRKEGTLKAGACRKINNIETATVTVLNK